MMRSFKTRLEAEVDHYGKYTVPSELTEAFMLAEYGEWNIFTIRATPLWVMQRVFFCWHLKHMQSEYEKRQMNKNAK